MPITQLPQPPPTSPLATLCFPELGVSHELHSWGLPLLKGTEGSPPPSLVGL
ncbi:unnamed protein product [Nyctereutes procyonoides]|uniref:(raccoon dog) hypothetical protein n=1 Tax=Nyctereutes procyonoides TaxID=34880 RepID=A0A811Z2C4_NYCPR|nr:unnamed protein product [Nyctereutes procyonoides]